MTSTQPDSGDIFRFRRDHMAAVWAYSSIENAKQAELAHSECRIGECATLTAADLKLRSYRLYAP